MAIRSETPVGVTVEIDFKTEVVRPLTEDAMGISENDERCTMFPDRVTAAIQILKDFGDQVVALHFTDVYGFTGAKGDEKREPEVEGRPRGGRRVAADENPAPVKSESPSHP